MKTILPVGSWVAWELEDTHKIVQYMGNGMYSHSMPPPLGKLNKYSVYLKRIMLIMVYTKAQLLYSF